MLDATPVGAVEMAGNRNVLLQAATVSGQFTIIRRRSNFHFMKVFCTMIFILNFREIFQDFK